MNALFLIGRLAGQTIAIPAADVDSVVHIRETAPVPLAPPHILGLAALRSRVITLVGGREAIGLHDRAAEDRLVAVVVTVDGHQYGLVVDQVDDICTVAGAVAPVGGRIAAGWSAVAAGMMEHEGASLLLLDPAALVAGPGREAA